MPRKMRAHLKPAKTWTPIPPQEVKLFPFNAKSSHTFKRISARSDKSLSLETESIDDVNEKLKEKAANLGANALIKVGYDKGIFTLFQGIRGYGTAVYIDNIENVEKAKPSVLSPICLFMALLIWGIQNYDAYGLIYGLIYIPAALCMVIIAIYNWRGYKNKNYFLAILGIIIVSVPIWLGYILKNGLQIFSTKFLLITSMFLIIPIIFIYEYLQRKKDPNLPWKDEWGF